MKTKVLLLQVLFLLAAGLNFYQDKTAKLDKLLSDYEKNEGFNGSVLVADSGKVIFNKGVGFSIMESQISNESDTRFRIGSLTKQFTSMLVMQLVSEGKIKLDNKISGYLPSYPTKSANRITIHHLLSHTSGIPNYTDFPEIEEWMLKEHKPEDFIKKFWNKELEFNPGSDFNYSNSGYFLLGVIIEKVTGKNYETNLKEKIFNPLGMKNSGYENFENSPGKRATGYIKKDDKYEIASFINISSPYAAGGIYSTVEDMYLWDRALYSNVLLPGKYKNIMFRPNIYNYAYGWGIANRRRSTPDDIIMSHGGGINGFSSSILRLPKHQRTIILLSNIEGDPMHELTTSIIKILDGK